MNKQVVIAGLLGAAAAADCEDQFTKSAADELAALEERRNDWASATEGLEEAAELEAQNVENVYSQLSAKNEQLSPLQSVLFGATENVAEMVSQKQTALELISLYGDTSSAGTTIGDAQAAMEAAEGLMNTAQGKYDDQVAANTKLAAAVTEHNAEVVTLAAALETATDLETAAIQAYADAEAVKTALEETRAEETTGQAAILSTKTSEYNTALEEFEAANAYFLTEDRTEEANEDTAAFTSYKSAKQAYDKKVKEIALLAIGCIFEEDINGDGSEEDLNCETQTSDEVGAIYLAALGGKAALETTYEEEEETWEPKVTTTANLQAAMLKAKAWKEVAQANDTVIENAALSEDSTISAALQAKNTATENKENAETDLETAETQEGNARTDLIRGENILAALLDDLTPLKDDHVVKTYLLAEEQAKLAVQTAEQEAADALLPDLQTLEEMAEETVDRAQLAVDFYQTRLTEAANSNEVAQQMLADNLSYIFQADEFIEGMKDQRRAAIAGCKGDRYTQAQKALRAKLDQDALDDVAIEEVKEKYDLAAAIPTGGVAGSLCNYTVRTSLDEDRGERPPCNEGLCCGAAQKFMQDGTKLAIETCQALTDKTYEYYPPLPARAVVAPAVETWRFQCISGAQKLVAAATAALAASYMMA